MSLLERFKLEERESEALNTKPKKGLIIDSEAEVEFDHAKSNIAEFED